MTGWRRWSAENGYRISTGFAGTPYVTDALTQTGHLDDAYRLLLERGCPSWLYPVTMGATTIWERWDSMLPDGTINPGEMTSFNHYALGAVADWIHRTVGGIAPLEPGYATVLIAPQPGGGLTWATASLETAHGLVEVHWRQTGEDLTVEAAVPAGATGVLAAAGPAGPGTGAGQAHHHRPLHRRGKSGEPVMSDADRAADIIAKMSTDDKVALACGDFAAVAHLGLPALSFTDGGNGVRVAGDATAFPVCLSLAASFDERLAHRFGSAVGREARSAGHNVLLGPALDIARTPLAGRLPEAFGEDPYLTGVLGAAYVRGVQETSWPWSSTSWSTTSRRAGPGPARRHRSAGLPSTSTSPAGPWKRSTSRRSCGLCRTPARARSWVRTTRSTAATPASIRSCSAS